MNEINAANLFPVSNYLLVLGLCLSVFGNQSSWWLLAYIRKKTTTWYEYLRANLAFRKSWNSFLSSSNSLKLWGHLWLGFFGLIFWIHGLEGLNCCSNWKKNCSEWLFFERLKDNIKCYLYNIETHIYLYNIPTTKIHLTWWSYNGLLFLRGHPIMACLITKHA
jgi:hypothetical protein